MTDFLSRTQQFAQKYLGLEVKRVSSPKKIINEAINFDLRAIFIAVPKTGTTSVRLQITEPGSPIIPNSHLDINQVRALIYVDLLRKTLGNNQQFPSEGVPEDDAIRSLANETFDSFFKFSAVRNPWARAVSLYFRREGVELKDKMSFAEFCDKHLYASDTCMHPTRHKNQYDWLCDPAGNNLMDYIYKVENFQEAIPEIQDRTNGRITLKNVSANKNPNSKSANYRELYTDATRKMIASRFEKDIDLFKYTF